MRCDVLLISLRCKRMSTWNSLFLLFSVVSLWCKGFHYSKYFHLTYLLNLFCVCVCVFILSPQLLQGNMYVFGGEFTATKETPLWTFNFRKCVVFSVEIILHLRSFPFLFWYRLLFFFLGSRVWRKQAAKSWVRLDRFSAECQKGLLMGDLSPAGAVISWQFYYHYSNFILRAPAL